MKSNDRPSYRRHRQQLIWQILAPIGLGLLLLAGTMTLAVLTATRGDSGGQVSVWADTAMIWMILPVILLAVVIVVLLFALVYLLARALKFLPVYTGLAQQYVGLAAGKVRYFADRLVAPLIRVRSSLAGVNRILRKISGKPFDK